MYRKTGPPSVIRSPTISASSTLPIFGFSRRRGILFLDRLSGLAGHEFIKTCHPQSHDHGRVAVVLPIPAVNAVPGRDKRAVRLRAGSFLIEHQVVAPAGRLGVAVKLGEKRLRIGGAR